MAIGSYSRPSITGSTVGLSLFLVWGATPISHATAGANVRTGTGAVRQGRPPPYAVAGTLPVATTVPYVHFTEERREVLSLSADTTAYHSYVGAQGPSVPRVLVRLTCLTEHGTGESR